MDEKTYRLISIILELIVKYGIPGTIQVIKAWQVSDDPTLEEIIALRNKVPRPETYFK